MNFISESAGKRIPCYHVLDEGGYPIAGSIFEQVIILSGYGIMWIMYPCLHCLFTGANLNSTYNKILYLYFLSFNSSKVKLPALLQKQGLI